MKKMTQTLNIDEPEQAKFNQSRNDMYWSVWAGVDKFIRWSGYDDAYWWDNVSTNEDWRTRIGPVTGRKFYLNPTTGEVTQPLGHE